jgi:hypothetical protein
MREFQVDLTKALPRGLSPLEKREGALLGLHECFNFVPDEIGLKPWDPLIPTGMSGGGYFNYLPIRDQTGKLWYWYPVFDGHILAGDTIPNEPDTNLIAIPVVGDPVEWVNIPDENNFLWKLYPDPGEGFTRITDSTPLTGVGLELLVWRGTTLETWTNKFETVFHTRYAVRVKHGL